MTTLIYDPPELNVELLDQTLEFIKANPEDWHQGEYRCGSGMCFAGWAAQLAGGKWVSNASSPWREGLETEEGDDPNTVQRAYLDGDKLSEFTNVSARAERILGLTPDEADRLFDGSNRMAELENVVYRLKTDRESLIYSEDYEECDDPDCNCDEEA